MPSLSSRPFSSSSESKAMAISPLLAALRLAVHADLHRGSQQVGELLLQPHQVARLVLLDAQQRRLTAVVVLCTRDQLLGIAHRQLLRHDLGGREDLVRVVQRQQRARMAHVEVAGHQHLLHRRGQVQQAQQVAGRTARPAHRRRRLLVGELEFARPAAAGPAPPRADSGPRAACSRSAPSPRPTRRARPSPAPAPRPGRPAGRRARGVRRR